MMRAVLSWMYILAMLVPITLCTKSTHVVFVSVDGGSERAIAAAAIANYLQSADPAYFKNIASFSSVSHIYDQKHAIDETAEKQSLDDTRLAFSNSIYGEHFPLKWREFRDKHFESLQKLLHSPEHKKGDVYHFYIVCDPKQMDDALITKIKTSLRNKVSNPLFKKNVRVFGVVPGGQDPKLKSFSATLRYAAVLYRIRALLDKFADHEKINLKQGVEEKPVYEWNVDAMKRKWQNEWKEEQTYFYDTELDWLETREQQLMGFYTGGNICDSNLDCDDKFDWECKCDKTSRQCQIGTAASADPIKPCPFGSGRKSEVAALWLIREPITEKETKAKSAYVAIRGDDYDDYLGDDGDDDDEYVGDEGVYHYMKAEDYTDAGMFTYRAYMAMFSVFTMISLCFCLLIGCCCGALVGFVAYQMQKKNGTIDIENV